MSLTVKNIVFPHYTIGENYYVNICFNYIVKVDSCLHYLLPSARCSSNQVLLCRSFFKSVLNKDSCLHYLLPNIRNRDIINKLRYTVLFDATTARTVKYKQSFINFALEHYQSVLI